MESPSRLVHRLALAVAALSLIVLIGRDLWVRHARGADSPEYRQITHQPS